MACAHDFPSQTREAHSLLWDCHAHYALPSTFDISDREHTHLGFYSLPTRAWELGIGALLLFIPVNIFKQRLLPWFGLSGLVLAALNYNDNTAFPGINALMPVVATALLLATISVWPPIFNDLSNNRISQWLGKSPILYLWHWPALVIPSSALGRPLNVPERFVCIAMTLVLAHITNRFIEEPMRHIRIAPRKLYLAALSTTLVSLAVGCLIAITASSIITTRGEPSYSFDLKKLLLNPLCMAMTVMSIMGRRNRAIALMGIKPLLLRLFSTATLMLRNGFLP